MRFRGVAAIDDECTYKVRVQFSDSRGGRAAAELREHLVARALQRLAADDRGDCVNTLLARAELLADARNREDRPNADERIARTNDDPLRVANRFEDSGRRVRVLSILKVDGANAGDRVVLDEVFLKVHAPFAGFDDGGDGLIGHRQDSGFNTQRVTNGLGRLRERLAMREHRGAMNVRGKVAVAEIEPCFVAVRAEALQEVKCVAAEAPAGLRIDDPGERVRHYVEIGRDAQAVQEDVVSGVRDDRQKVWVHDLMQAEEELRSTDAAGKGGDGKVLYRGHCENSMPRRAHASKRKSRQRQQTINEIRIQKNESKGQRCVSETNPHGRDAECAPRQPVPGDSGSRE